MFPRRLDPGRGAFGKLAMPIFDWMVMWWFDGMLLDLLECTYTMQQLRCKGKVPSHSENRACSRDSSEKNGFA